MGQDDAPVQFPLGRLLMVTGIAGLFFLIAAAFSAWALTAQSDVESRSTVIQNQVARISLEDDSVTDSARLVVLDGDPRWLTRFDDAVARLADALTDLDASVHDLGAGAEVERVKEQSARLRTLDRSILVLVDEGRPDEARSLLNSAEYVAAKASFDADVEAARTVFRGVIADDNAQVRALVWITWLLRIITLATVAFLVVLVVRMSRQWARAETSRMAGQLARAEEWTGLAIERSNRGLGVIDPAAAAFKHVNARLAELLAIKASTLLEPGAVLGVLPELEDGSHPLEALATGNLADYEVERFHERAGQDSLWLRWRLTALSGADGSPTGVLADVMDVTTRRAREAQLQQELREDTNFAELVRAIDDDRLVLFRQPIVEISTGAFTSFELLLRMDDGHGGFRSPDTFLPTAEKRGLSLMIDLWVIRQATELALHGMPVSVNISGASIGRPELLPGIRAALQQPELDPATIIFEITETAMLTGWADAEALAKAIAELGAAVALDDFGTGHSGFAYLRHIKASWIKIDKEFVLGAVSDQRDRDLITTIVRLATLFGARTIGEGVEDQPTLELLKSLGVTHAQGFHLGRPAPIPSA